MKKNCLKPYRNPNSQQAIQARLDGYQDVSAYEDTYYIFNKEEKFIFIDLTSTKSHQKINYELSGGAYKLNKKLVRNNYNFQSDGYSTITSYFIDTVNGQWLVMKSYLNFSLPKSPSSSPSIPIPRPTYGNTFGGFYASARGETWRNERRSVDKIREAQKRIYDQVTISPNADEVKHLPKDSYEDDFTGNH